MSETHDFRSIGPHMVRGAAWMVAMRWSLRLIGLANVIVLARLLAPEDFGLVAMATVVVGFLQMLADVNVDLVLLREQGAGRAHYDTAWTVQAGSGVAIMALLFALAPLLADYYGDERVTAVVWIIALRAGIVGFENIGTVDFRKQLDFRREFRFWVARRLVDVVFVLALALVLRNYLALAIAQPIAGLTTVGLSYAMSAYRPRFSLAKLGEIWSFSQWLILLNTAKFVNGRVDEFIVGGLAGPTRLGHYFMASSVSTMPTSELVMPIGRALVPTYAKIAHDPAELMAAFRSVLGYVAVIAFSVGIGMAVIAEDLVYVVLGEKWAPAIPFFRWLALYGVFAGLLQSLLPYFVVHKAERLYALAAVGHAAFLVPVLVAAGSLFGILEIAVARTGVTVIVAVVMFALVTRLGPVTAGQIAAQLWRPALAGAVMAAAVTGLHADAIETRLYTLALDVVTGAAVFTVALAGLWLIAGRPAGPERTVLGLCRRWLGARRGPGRRSSRQAGG